MRKIAPAGTGAIFGYAQQDLDPPRSGKDKK